MALDTHDKTGRGGVWKSGTGKGIRVGILDTGVVSDLACFDGSIGANFEVEMRGENPEVASSAQRPARWLTIFVSKRFSSNSVSNRILSRQTSLGYSIR